MSIRRNMASLLLTASMRSIERKYRWPAGNTSSCVQREPVFLPGAAVRYWKLCRTATKSWPRITSGVSCLACVQIWGPSIERLARLPC